MKKLFTLFIAVTMVLVITGCANIDGSDTQTSLADKVDSVEVWDAGHGSFLVEDTQEVQYLVNFFEELELKECEEFKSAEEVNNFPRDIAGFYDYHVYFLSEGESIQQYVLYSYVGDYRYLIQLEPDGLIYVLTNKDEAHEWSDYVSVLQGYPPVD